MHLYRYVVVSKEATRQEENVLTLDNCDFLLCYNRKLTLRNAIAVKDKSLRLDFVLRKEVLQVLSEHVRQVSNLIVSRQKSLHYFRSIATPHNF